MVDFKMNDKDKDVCPLDHNNYKINAREFFVSTQVSLGVILSYLLCDLSFWMVSVKHCI